MSIENIVTIANQIRAQTNNNFSFIFFTDVIESRCVRANRFDSGKVLRMKRF